ncbi:MAG: efflux RND transporter permease subunit, partial [Kordiimonas sp.]
MTDSYSSTLRERSLVGWFAVHPTASFLLLAFLLLAGLKGMTSMRQEVFPPFAPNQIEVSVVVRGASPEEVERLVVWKIEQSLSGLEGIERIIADASQDYASIQVELTADADTSRMLTLVKSRVDSISNFPAYAEKPVISMPEAVEPVMAVSVTGNIPIRALFEQALNLEKVISNVPGVSYAAIEDRPEFQVNISIKPVVLEALGITFSDISKAVSEMSVRQASGAILTEKGQLILRSATMALDETEFGKTPVKTLQDGSRVTLKQVADITIEPDDNYVVPLFNGLPSLKLTVRKEMAGDLASVSNGVRQVLEDYQHGLGHEINVVAWQDQSREYASRGGLLLKNGVLGFILICLVLGAFIEWRVAFWTAVGIPVSMIGAVGFLYFSGVDISLNAITLFGFLIASGLIVDDALVIGESIHSETQRAGHTLDNIVNGAKKVAMPATFGALTTMAAFFPLTLTEGEMGSRLGSVGLVVIFCLIASLIESKLILPAHLRGKKGESVGRYGVGNKLALFQKRANGFLVKLNKWYCEILLEKALSNPKTTLLSGVVFLGLSVALVVTGIVSVTVVPDIADYDIGGDFKLEANLTRAQKEQIRLRLLDTVSETNTDVRNLHNLDYDPIWHSDINVKNDEVAVFIELKNVESTPYDTHSVARAWRQYLPSVPGVQ